MLESPKIQGVIPAIVSPFDGRDAVDLDTVSKLVDDLCIQGVNGIMTTGGTGEFPQLDRRERRAITEAAVQAAGDRVPVVAGTAACSVKEALLLTDDAAVVGATAAILVPPFYFPLPEAALIAFFDAVAARSPIPLVVYNNPLYTGNPLRPGTIVELLERPNIVSVKQSESDLGQLAELVYQVKVVRQLDRTVLTGIDSQFLAALTVGADGIFSTAAGIVPAPIVSLLRAYRSQGIEEARRAHDNLQSLNRFLEYDPGYVGPAKEALGLLGYHVGSPRPPLPTLSEAQRAELATALRQLAVMSSPN